MIRVFFPGVKTFTGSSLKLSFVIYQMLITFEHYLYSLFMFLTSTQNVKNLQPLHTYLQFTAHLQIIDGYDLRDKETNHHYIEDSKTEICRGQ